MFKKILYTLFITLVLPTIALAGTTSTNGYFYLPGVGEYGTTVRSTWLATQEATDAVIKANTDDRHDEMTLSGNDYITLSGQALTAGTVDISDDTNLTAGTNITLTGDELNVDDAFILNDGDTATGVYNFNSNDLVIDSVSSNIGIGTSAPSTKLEVDGTVTATAFVGDGSGITDVTSTGGWGVNGDDYYYTDGNVGIGTSTPSQALDIVGNIAVSGTVDGKDVSALIDGSGTANYIPKFSDADTITDSIIFDDGSNIGIGTSAPNYKLSVAGDTADSVRFFYDNADVGNTTNGQPVYFYRRADEGDDYLKIQTDQWRVSKIDASNYLEFNAGNAITFNSDGGVTFGGAGDNDISYFIGYITAGGTYEQASFQVNDTTDNFEMKRSSADLLNFDIQMPLITDSIDAQGNVGIGTSATTYTLKINDDKVTTLKEKCFTLESPTDDDDDVPFFYPQEAITVNEIRCISQGGTSTVVVVGDGTNNMDSITCATTTTSDASLSNNTFTANERMEFNIGTVTGTVDWVNYCIRYLVD